MTIPFRKDPIRYIVSLWPPASKRHHSHLGKHRPWFYPQESFHDPPFWLEACSLVWWARNAARRNGKPGRPAMFIPATSYCPDIAALHPACQDLWQGDNSQMQERAITFNFVLHFPQLYFWAHECPPLPIPCRHPTRQSEYWSIRRHISLCPFYLLNQCCA